MSVTRNVIIDLLPVYLADEASQDTRELVEAFLENDQELTEIVENSKVDLPDDIPVPLTQEDKMKTYLEIKKMAYKRTVTLAIVFASIFVTVLAFLGAAAFVFIRFLN